jgi:hypothetical protein
VFLCGTKTCYMIMLDVLKGRKMEDGGVIIAMAASSSIQTKLWQAANSGPVRSLDMGTAG